jgi:hypothetical protein
MPVVCRDSFTPAASLADGEHVFAVRVAGAAGAEAADHRAIQIDTLAPQIALQAPGIPVRTSERRPVLRFTTDDASGVTTTCSVDADAAVPCDGQFNAGAALSEGSHGYHVTATDAAGNSSEVDIAFVVDLTPPEVAITLGPVDPTNDDTPSFAFTTSADTTRARCEMDTGEVIDPCVSGVTLPALAPGDRTFTVTAFDDAVPPNVASATYHFMLGVCGDGAAQGSEQCDAADLRGQSCIGLGLTGGSLTCTASCTYDTRGCTGCGNGILESGEQCDGTDLGGATCRSRGFDSGALTCSTTCTFDTVGCGRCGDGVKNGGELCDGTDVGSATCASLGHAPGTLACSADCNTIDVTGCDGGFVPANTGGDRTQLAGTTCVGGIAIPLSGANVGVCTNDDGVWRLTVAGSSATGSFVISGAATWLKADGAGSTASGPAVQDQTPGSPGINSVTSDRGRGIVMQDAQTSFDYFTRDLGNGTGLPTSGTFSAPFPTWNSFRSAASPFNQNPPVWTLGPGFSSWGEQVFAMKWGGGGSAPIHYVGGWDSAGAQAFVRFGQSISRDCGPPLNLPANNCSTKVLLGPSVTGTVTAMATGVLNLSSQNAFDLHAVVFGRTNIDGADPSFTTNGDAVGGIFWTPDHGQHYVEDDVGIGAGNNDCATSSDGTGFGNDRNLVFSGVADPSTYSTRQPQRTDPGGSGSPYPVANLETYAATMYVGLRGGGSLYKTTNGGASWCRANRGLPPNVEVFQIAIDCYGAAIGAACNNPSLLYAATSRGLYKSNDGGLQWTLAGLEGKVVRAVALQVAHTAGVTPYILTASDQPNDVWQRIIQDTP